MRRRSDTCLRDRSAGISSLIEYCTTSGAQGHPRDPPSRGWYCRQSLVHSNDRSCPISENRARAISVRRGCSASRSGRQRSRTDDGAELMHELRMGCASRSMISDGDVFFRYLKPFRRRAKVPGRSSPTGERARISDRRRDIAQPHLGMKTVADRRERGDPGQDQRWISISRRAFF